MTRPRRVLDGGLRSTEREARPQDTALKCLRASWNLLGLAFCSACGSHPQGGSCASTDMDCFLSSLTVQQGGAPVALRSVDASRMSSSAGPPSLWALGSSTSVALTTGAVSHPSWIAGWNGNWAIYSNRAPSTPLNAVWAFATNDAGAAGAKDTVLHWDGTPWSVVTLGGLPRVAERIP